jgi:hypothetical protein
MYTLNIERFVYTIQQEHFIIILGANFIKKLDK